MGPGMYAAILETEPKARIWFPLPLPAAVPSVMIQVSTLMRGEASLRTDYVDTNFYSRDLVSSTGGRTNYASGSMYYGAHVGTGYVWNIDNKTSLDLSTKNIWLHLSGRFAYAVSRYVVAPYAGTYFDYAFDGKAKATAYGYTILTLLNWKTLRARAN